MHSDHGDDPLLLAQYLSTRDERALRRIMERYMPMVYSVGHRTTGSHALAAETSQDVFLKLSQNPLALMRGVPLAAWLHRVARTRAVDLLRAEKRRTVLQENLRLQDHSPSGPGLSEEGFALLDEVIDQLPAPDRNLVLQRYLFGESFVALSRTLGISEDAARMRANRTLEKMRSLFASRGVRTTSAILATALPAHGFLVPPPALVATTLAKVTSTIAGSLPTALLRTVYRLSAPQKYAAAGGLLVIVAGLAAAGLASSRDAGAGKNTAALAESPPPRIAADGTTLAPASPDHENANLGQDSRATAKASRLDEWIKRWNRLPLNPDPYTATDAEKSLCEQAVASLGCTTDLVGFVKFLKSAQCPLAQDLVNAGVAAQCRAGHAAEIRADLIRLADGAEKTARDTFGPWLRIAGETSSKAEVLELCAALGDDSDLTLVTMEGYYATLAKTEPAKALIENLAEYQKRYDPATGWGPIPPQPHLSDLFQQLPVNAPFEEIEHAIPLPDGKNPPRDEMLTFLRSTLFSRWGAADTSAATSYLMDHPETLAPSLMSSVLGGAIWGKDLDASIAWLMAFPAGKYYDAGISGENFLVGFGEDRREEQVKLAERIQDPALREKAVRHVKTVQYPHDCPPQDDEGK